MVLLENGWRRGTRREVNVASLARLSARAYSLRVMLAFLGSYLCESNWKFDFLFGLFRS
jgi:hypothetical protein